MPATAATPGPPPAVLRLSLEQALALGLERSLPLQSAAVAIEQNRSLVALASSAFLPKLDLLGLGTYAQVGTDINFISNVSTIGDLNINLGSQGYAVVQNAFGNLGLALSYPLIDFRRGPLRDAARANLAAARSQQMEQQRISRFAITAAYLHLQLADALIPVWQRSLDVSTRLRRDVNAIRARGLASRSDSAQAEALLENDRRGLAEAEAQVEISRSGLARLLALPADQAVAATDRLQPGPAWGQDLPSTIRRSLLDRPSLAALEQQRQAQLAQVQLARAARLPSVGLLLGGGINANRIDLPVLSTSTTVGLSSGPSAALPQQSAGASQSGSFYDWGALISLRQPLFDGGSARAATAVAQRQVEQQQIAIASAEQAIIQNVETWWQTHRATAAQITAAAAAARAGELAVRDAELRYRAGISPILEVMITQRDLQLARTALAVSVHRWNLSRAGLELETGAAAPQPSSAMPAPSPTAP